VVVSDRAVFPVDFLVQIIEGVMPTHLKEGCVTPKSWSNIVHVDESNAWLTYYQRIGGRRNNAVGDVRLKVNYAGACEIEIVTPSGHNWIRLYSSVSALLKER
jgi:hypothetical protein